MAAQEPTQTSVKIEKFRAPVVGEASAQNPKRWLDFFELVVQGAEPDFKAVRADESEAQYNTRLATAYKRRLAAALEPDTAAELLARELIGAKAAAKFWADVRAGFETAFGTVQAQGQALQALRARRQGAGETVGQYASAFIQLAGEAGTSWDAEALAFIANLHPDILERLPDVEVSAPGAGLRAQKAAAAVEANLVRARAARASVATSATSATPAPESAPLMLARRHPAERGRDRDDRCWFCSDRGHSYKTCAHWGAAGKPPLSEFHATRRTGSRSSSAPGLPRRYDDASLMLAAWQVGASLPAL